MLRINYTSNLSFDFPHYYNFDKSWYELAETETKKFFSEVIKDDFTIIDAGAQIGMYSVLFGKLATNGKVYAFEPTDTAGMLQENLNYNNCDNVDVRKIALSNKDGKYKDVIYKLWSQNMIDDKEFEFITIDTFAKQNNLKIDLIKIDVDSYDFEVLQGSKNVLQTQEPIVVVELNHALHKRSYTPQNAIDFMDSIGYKIQRLFDNENYYFVKK